MTRRWYAEQSITEGRCGPRDSRRCRRSRVFPPRRWSLSTVISVVGDSFDSVVDRFDANACSGTTILVARFSRNGGVGRAMDPRSSDSFVASLPTHRVLDPISCPLKAVNAHVNNVVYA